MPAHRMDSLCRLWQGGRHRVPRLSRGPGTSRSPCRRKGAGHESTGHRRGRVHRLAPVPPAARGRARRLGRGQRVQRPAGEPCRQVPVHAGRCRPARRSRAAFAARAWTPSATSPGRSRSSARSPIRSLDLRTNVEGTLNVLQAVPQVQGAAADLCQLDDPVRGRARPCRRPRPSRAGPTPTTGSPSMRPSATSTPRRSGRISASISASPRCACSASTAPASRCNNPYQGVLGIFLGNILRGEPITIFGDGEQTRDFVYIDDIVDGWVRALNTPAAAGRRLQSRQRALAVHQPACRRRHRRVRSCAAAATDHPRAGPAGRAAHGAGRHRARPRLVLGWEPRTPFEAGLAETLRWAREEFAADPARAQARRSAAR